MTPTQRRYLEHAVRCEGPLAARRNDGLAEGIDRAGADIAVDDANGTERERPEPADVRFPTLGLCRRLMWHGCR